MFVICWDTGGGQARWNLALLDFRWRDHEYGGILPVIDQSTDMDGLVQYHTVI